MDDNFIIRHSHMFTLKCIFPIPSAPPPSFPSLPFFPTPTPSSLLSPPTHPPNTHAETQKMNITTFYLLVKKLAKFVTNMVKNKAESFCNINSCRHLFFFQAQLSDKKMNTLGWHLYKNWYPCTGHCLWQFTFIFEQWLKFQEQTLHNQKIPWLTHENRT